MSIAKTPANHSEFAILDLDQTRNRKAQVELRAYGSSWFSAPQHVCICGNVVKAQPDGCFWLYQCTCGRSFSQHRESLAGRFAFDGYPGS